MAAIITEKFRQHNAEQFFESFSESAASNYYLFIGKSSPFTSTTSGGSDTSPPVPTDIVTVDNYKWDSMLAAKRIGTTDVSYVIPRRDWTVGGTFDMYEHDINASNTTTSGASNLVESTFYFMTDEYKVYKVLDNNNGASYTGSAAPTTTQSDPFFEGGYYLQYMYSLTTSEVQKFLTSDFIPVSTDATVSGDAETNSGDSAPFVGAPVKVIRVTGGSGYSDTNATDGIYYSPIRGDGSGGVVKIKVSGGEIQSFGSTSDDSQIENPGSGYTFANVDLTDCYEESSLTTPVSIGSGTGGAVVPIITPRVGHGHDAVAELGGHFVMVNVKLEQSEGDDFSVANDFREVGLLVDPSSFGSTSLYSATTARQTMAVKFSSVSGSFEPDEKITQTASGAVGRVVEWDATNDILYFVQEQWENYGVNSDGDYVAFTGTDDIVGSQSSATGVPQSTASETVTLAGGNTTTFTSGYSNPELQPDSGKVIYIENRRPISRASDQTEDIKIVIEF